MSSIDFSSFFGGTNNTQSPSLYNMLGDYHSIKSGSYGKLLKAYYKKQNQVDDEEVKTENTKLSRLKTYASDLKDAAASVNDASLFRKGEFETTLSDGTKKSTEYDMDAIYDKVKNFVDKYNSMIGNATSYEDGSAVSKKALSLIEYTSKNSNLLSQIGITADTSEGKEGQLKIDEDTFKKASAGTVKTLFQGQGSYASVVENKASLIASVAESQISKYSSYNARGSYDAGSASLSSIFNSGV